MYSIITFAVAFILALIHLKCSKKPATGKRFFKITLAYILPINIGLLSLWSFYGHVFHAELVAKMIGWANSPFQYEIGMANLALGVAGVLCIFWRRKFWLATVVFNSVFLFGDAVGHFMQMAKGDHAQYNTGLFLYANDIVVPAVILIFTLIYCFQRRVFCSSECTRNKEA